MELGGLLGRLDPQPGQDLRGCALEAVDRDLLGLAQRVFGHTGDGEVGHASPDVRVDALLEDTDEVVTALGQCGLGVDEDVVELPEQPACVAERLRELAAGLQGLVRPLDRDGDALGDRPRKARASRRDSGCPSKADRDQFADRFGNDVAHDVTDDLEHDLARSDQARDTAGGGGNTSIGVGAIGAEQPVLIAVLAGPPAGVVLDPVPEVVGGVLQVVGDVLPGFRHAVQGFLVTDEPVQWLLQKPDVLDQPPEPRAEQCRQRIGENACHPRRPSHPR
nr:hypothetical protein [Lentzea nigeriaca]